MNWLKLLVGISALIIAGCAAYFSVTGLGVLFSGASVAVMVMASSLELAKLVAATYLKQKWDEIQGFNKWYLTSAVIVLMIITSAGIFGYLSNAFQQQNLKLNQIDREIAVYDTKITQNNSEITRFTTQINNLQNIRNSQEANISKIVDKNGSTSRLTKMVANADKEISQISQKINDLNEDNNLNYSKINEIKNANIDVEKEVGGFRFVAEAFGFELNTIVKFFIFLIVIVFDPLAVALIIAFNGMVSNKKRKTKEILTEMMQNDQKLGLYEIYGDKKEDIVENIIKNEDSVEKNSIEEEDSSILLENNENSFESAEIKEQTSEITNELENLKWEEYMHPDFPWHKRNVWINNPKAVNYWMNTKGGNYKELSKIKIEEENTKKY